MTRVLTEQFLTRYAAANYNQLSRGVNGSDRMILMTVAPVDRTGREGPLAAGSPVPQPAARAALDPEVAEGYSSAAGLGLVLMTATGAGAVAVVTVVARFLMGALA